MVNLIDMYPTLIELCGLPENPVLDGRSFAPLLRNPDMEWNHPTLTNGCFPGFYRVYDGRYSYISHRQRGAEELYDHQQDPMEWTNLAGNPEYAGIKARLKGSRPANRRAQSHRRILIPPSKRRQRNETTVVLLVIGFFKITTQKHDLFHQFFSSRCSPLTNQDEVNHDSIQATRRVGNGGGARRQCDCREV